MMKKSFVLTFILSVLAFAVAAQNIGATSASTNTILLTFKGGNVRQSDFSAFIDYKTVFYSNGDRRSPQYPLYNNNTGQEEVLNRIAFNKIAKLIIQRNKLDEKDYFTLRMKNNSYRMAWEYFMLTQMYPVIREARKPWEEKWLNYYEENIEEFTEPDEVYYRMIFFNMIGLNEEEKQKKYHLAEKIRKEIEKEPQVFAALAKEYSEADESARGGVLGPSRLDKITQTLAEAIRKLRIGEISPVIRSGEGLFILLIEDFKKGKPKPFPEVRRFVVANVGEFYVYDIVKDFKKKLIGDAEPVFLNDNISTAPADLDNVIARLGETEIKTREVEYQLMILYDARFVNHDELKSLLYPLLEKKAIFESAKSKGYLNSKRFVNYMNTYTEDQYAVHFIRLYHKKELPEEFRNLGVVEELLKELPSRYNARLIRYPEIPPVE